MKKLSYSEVLSKIFELEDERNAILSNMVLISKEDWARLDQIDEDLAKFTTLLEEMDGSK